MLITNGATIFVLVLAAGFVYLAAYLAVLSKCSVTTEAKNRTTARDARYGRASS
jgi:hypothetical protein